MAKHWIALAIAGVVSAPLAAQNSPPADTAQVEPAKAEKIKKTVCKTEVDRLHNVHKVCRTVEVPAEVPANPQQPSADTGQK